MPGKAREIILPCYLSYSPHLAGGRGKNEIPDSPQERFCENNRNRPARNLNRVAESTFKILKDPKIKFRKEEKILNCYVLSHAYGSEC